MGDVKAKRTYVLTEEGRASLLSAIRKNRPWTQSCGPKTPAGKARAGKNAVFHGERSAAVLKMKKQIKETLQLCRQAGASAQ